MASLLFGTSVLAVAFGLETHRRRQEPDASTATELDRAYVNGRRRGRAVTNALVAAIGSLAGIAGLVGAGHLWLVLWSLIPMLVLAIVVLALGDALRTDRYMRDKLPELRDQAFGTVAAVESGAPAVDESLTGRVG